MGNGQTNEPPGTTSMWANMLGLGPIMATIQDPAFLAQVKSILDAIAETRARCQAIEAWCVRLSEQIERLEYGAITAAPSRTELGTAVAGGCAAPGGIADDGASSVAAPAGGARNGSGRAGVSSQGGP
jgi:hypothetical protein